MNSDPALSVLQFEISSFSLVEWAPLLAEHLGVSTIVGASYSSRQDILVTTTHGQPVQRGGSAGARSLGTTRDNAEATYNITLLLVASSKVSVTGILRTSGASLSELAR